MLKKITKTLSNTKILNKMAFLILTLFCCCLVLSLSNISTSAEYTLANKGRMVVDGVKGGGNCSVFPITHPAFVVQLYKSPSGMDTKKNGYNDQANAIKTVIPYASQDALWLCSNDLSAYLIRQKFDTPEQVYVAQKSSLSSKSIDLLGGDEDKKSTRNIRYLSNYRTTELNSDFSKGIFYNTLLKYYIADNRSFKVLAEDSRLGELLDKPSTEQKKYSMELWSYITDADAKGSDDLGWNYTINIRPKIDGFLQVNADKNDSKYGGNELYTAGLRVNDWEGTSLKPFETNNYNLTVGEAFNLRYLDLLMTLNAISSNNDYWIKNIKSYITDNNGATNISITSGVVERLTVVSIQGGKVEPATVFTSCNDLTQVAYRVEEAYNLSGLKSSQTVYTKANSSEYLDRLKKAVSLSQPSKYYHDTIYRSEFISRIIAERVRDVENNKLIWGSSYNNTSMSRFLWFQLDGERWEGANWVLEPPVSTVAVNYKVILNADSTDFNKLKSKTGPLYQMGTYKIELFKLSNLFSTEIKERQKIVPTKDEVNLQVTLKALTTKGDSAGGIPALNEWQNFIRKNNISQFQVKVMLSRNCGGTSFTPIPQNNRKFPQIHTGSKEWCTSSSWVPVTAGDLMELLKGKKPIGGWTDDTIAAVKVTEDEGKKVEWCSKVCIQYKAQNGNWYYLSGKENKTTETPSESKEDKDIADIKQSNSVAFDYWWRRNPLTPTPTGSVTSSLGNPIDYPADTWTSEEPALAYAELKEGSIYNETFEAMAGVPTTRTLYFSSGGNEFMADLQVNYEANSTAVRKYTSHFNGTECEFKTGDQAKSYTVPSPSGATGTPDVTVNVHDGDLTVSATWKGDIPNKATTQKVTALHSASATCTAIPDRTAYDAAKIQAGSWVTTLHGYSISHTAASDGKTREVNFSDASITTDSAVDPLTTTASDSKACSYKPSTPGPNGTTIPGTPCGNEMATAIAEPGPAGSYSITVTATIPAHVICGPCCQHDLPAISDTWTQYITYDTIDITKCNVYKIQNGYVTGMGEITYDSNEDLIASITQGDPNIFYNIVAYNNPTYSQGALTNASRIGRIRYTLQEAQGDDVYYEEMASGVTKRTNKCDGLASTVCASNPIPAGGKGHNETYATGCLYTNTAYKNEERKNAATTGTKSAYSSETDTKDLATAEWQRFWQRRTQSVTATVISDMLILQTSSGDQSPVYYTENATAKAQENFPTLRAAANGSTSIKSTSDEDEALKGSQNLVDAKWAKMWTNNTTSFAKVLSDGINVGSYNGKYNLPFSKYQGTGSGAMIPTRFDKDADTFSLAQDELGLAQVTSKQSFTKPANGSGNIASPGKLQARMDKVTKNLLMYVDKIKQKPTNKNAEYDTGASYVYYAPILKYSAVSDESNKTAGDQQIDGSGPEEDFSDDFEEKESDILNAAGYKYGPGLIYESKYSAYNDNSDYKVNNIITLDGVSVQNAMIVKSDVEDQRTEDGIVKDAMKTLEALEKCPGTPELCEYRVLNCKYTLDTTSLSFDFEDKINTASATEGGGVYAPYTGQTIKNNLANSDGAHASFELPDTMALTAGDAGYSGFGTGQMLKISGIGSRMPFPYNDCQITTNASSRVKISADVYLPSIPTANTMLFSIGGIGLYLPANGVSPVFVTSTGQTRAASGNIIGKRVKITAIFSLGSLYDCELAIDGANVISQITTGLTDAQIAAAAVSEDMRGSGLNLGCWENDNNYATNFYVDNVTITRCGGSLQHTASCYTTEKQAVPVYQDLFNGITSQTKSASSTTYSYTGDMQTVTLDPGTYKLEAYGGTGGDGTNHNQSASSHGGLGGYSAGTLTLTEKTKLYLYAGGEGGYGKGGYNGGGSSIYGYGGGGATDIRLTAPNNYANVISSSNPYIGKFADSLNIQGSVGDVSTVTLSSGETALKYTAGAQHLAATVPNVFTAGHTYRITFDAWTTGKNDVLHIDAFPDTLPETTFDLSPARATYTTSISSNLNDMNNARFRIFASGETFNGNVYVTNIRVYDTNQAANSIMDYDSLKTRILVAGGGGGADNADGGALYGADDGSGGAGGGTVSGNASIDGVPVTGLPDINGLVTKNFDGATWARVIYQDISANTNYFTASNYLSVNQSGLFSCLGRLSEFKNGSKYEFLLEYPDASGIFEGKYNRWKQTNSPLDEKTNNGVTNTFKDVTGYEAIHVDMPGYAGHGLEFNGINAILDGTVSFDNWWLCVGIMNTSYAPTNTTYKPYTMPGPHDGSNLQGTSQVALWVRVDGLAGKNGSGTGGTQTTGYALGQGESSSVATDTGGGGGGYYGGFVTNHNNGGGGGGSGYVSGKLAAASMKNGVNSGNGYINISKISAIDWNGKYNDGSYGVTTNYNSHVHSSSCLTSDSEGYQIALAEAKSGSWADLKRELGNTLFSMLVSKFGIDTSSGYSGSGTVNTGTAYNFEYTGNYQTFTAPAAGTYKLEAWGAQGGASAHGGLGGLGGYSAGTIYLSTNQTVTVYVGGMGNTVTGGWNGGGSTGYSNPDGAGGGGGTDIRINGTDLTNRVIVAGGGGGSGCTGDVGGAGGGTNGNAGSGNNYGTPGYGGTQFGGGYSVNGSSGSFGQGGNAYTGFSWSGGGGGGGYYGGGAGESQGGGATSGGGGSGYIGGVLEGTMSSGIGSGNGAAKITVLRVKTFPDETEIFNYIQANKNLIPDKVTSNESYSYSIGDGMAESNVTAVDRNGTAWESITYGPYKDISKGRYQVVIYGKGLLNSQVDVMTNNGVWYNIENLTVTDTKIQYEVEIAKDILAGTDGGGIEFRVFHSKSGYTFTREDITPIDSGGNVLNKVTIVNPIWNCKLENNTGTTYTEQTVLTCTEPHHFGSHYDYSSTICWDACNKDENHKSTKTEAFDANGNKVEQAAYITLDNFFKVYFPNTGDFYGDGSQGLLETSVNRGKGYTQNMDTTEWAREKYVKFDFDVLYERNGVWENHPAGDWIALEIIDQSTTKTYTLSEGTKLSLDGSNYVFDTARNLMSCNGGSTTLVEGGTMAVMNGKIFVVKGDGTVSVSNPCTEYNFYCLLENNEASCIEAQFATEAINYDDQSSIDSPYTGNDEHEEEYDIYTYGNTYSTNKERFGDFTSNQTAGKLGYLDIVGRIGNLIIEDTDDMRFSNYFKKPVAANNDDWMVQGIISKVDCSISEHYLSWHRNAAGYPLALDIRGEQVSKENGYNTWGAQEWTAKAKSESMGLSADKNSNSILKTEEQKLGYNVLFDVTTMGDYNRYLQVIPYFYALNKKTNELIPVDVYVNENGDTKPLNYFGLYSEYMDNDGNYSPGYETLANKLYKYTMYLNWTDESARRNYTAGEREASITDAVRDYFIEDVRDSSGEIIGYKYLTVPFGNFYNLGTMQCLQPGLRARTFVGSSQVTSIKEQSARLGITSNGINGGINTNFDGAYVDEMFYHQAQRWHLTMGLPSSAVFTAYREKGIHVQPEDNWYTASYVEGGVTKTKQFSQAYLFSNASDKEYAIGSTFLISGVQYTITGKYGAGTEFNNNDDYVILMTADIKAIGDVWNLKYTTGNDNGNVTIDGKTFNFGSSIPTFIAAYDTTSSLVDISTQNTH